MAFKKLDKNKMGKVEKSLYEADESFNELSGLIDERTDPLPERYLKAGLHARETDKLELLDLASKTTSVFSSKHAQRKKMSKKEVDKLNAQIASELSWIKDPTPVSGFKGKDKTTISDPDFLQDIISKATDKLTDKIIDKRKRDEAVGGLIAAFYDSFASRRRGVGRLYLGTMLASAGTAAGVGAIIGTFIFPGIGTAVGGLLGGLGAGIVLGGMALGGAYFAKTRLDKSPWVKEKFKKQLIYLSRKSLKRLEKNYKIKSRVSDAMYIYLNNRISLTQDDIIKHQLKKLQYDAFFAPPATDSEKTDDPIERLMRYFVHELESLTKLKETHISEGADDPELDSQIKMLKQILSNLLFSAEQSGKIDIYHKALVQDTFQDYEKRIARANEKAEKQAQDHELSISAGAKHIPVKTMKEIVESLPEETDTGPTRSDIDRGERFTKPVSMSSSDEVSTQAASQSTSSTSSSHRTPPPLPTSPIPSKATASTQPASHPRGRRPAAIAPRRRVQVRGGDLGPPRFPVIATNSPNSFESAFEQNKAYCERIGEASRITRYTQSDEHTELELSLQLQSSAGSEALEEQSCKAYVTPSDDGNTEFSLQRGIVSRIRQPAIEELCRFAVGLKLAELSSDVPEVIVFDLSSTPHPIKEKVKAGITKALQEHPGFGKGKHTAQIEDGAQVTPIQPRTRVSIGN